MQIRKIQNETELTVAVIGRLDTTTAPEFENELKESLEGVEELVLDLKELEYISSAGLRVMLMLQKTMNKQGKMRVLNANPDICEVFDITGFSDILTLE